MEPLRIAFLDPLGLPYDGNTLNHRGLGGSESATILMAQELSKIGFEVTIFNHCDYPGMYDIVRYENISFFDKSDGSTEVPHILQQDIVVVLRTVEPFLDPKYQTLMTCAKFKVVMAHDTFLRSDHRCEDLLVNGVIDEMFVLSDFQNYYMSTCHHGGRRRNPEVLKNKIFQTRNGVVRHIQEVDVTQKDKNLFVYNASVTKGMVPLVQKIWPLIKTAIPEAKLTVIGGYYKFAEGDKPDEQEQNWRKMSSNPINLANGIEFLGIIKQDEIAKILSKATYFLYPGAFPETFGISTLEALSYNVIPITTKFGALEETAVENASYLIDYAIEPNNLYPEINADLQVQKFVEMTVRAYNTPYLNMQKQQYANIVHEVSGWNTVALQWKAHFVKKLGKYLPVDEYRRVQKINTRVHEIFGRRFSNSEEWASYKTVPEQHIKIIVPCWNAQDYIADCIRSIASQDYDNYQVLIINDASTDNTEEVIRNTISELSDDVAPKFTTRTNKENKGAVRNQIEGIASFYCNPRDLVMLLDGDDTLVNRNDIFQFYNTLFDENVEFAYGSCWSMVDSIPLVAQEYSKAIRDAKGYRSHRFPWIMPYPHLRVFRRHLLDESTKVDSKSYKDEKGEWYRAGGDNAVFFNIIEAAHPDKIRVVRDIFYNYNDASPTNDFKIHGEEQMKTANAIAPKVTSADILSTSVFDFKPPRKFVGLEGLKKFAQKGADVSTLAEAKPPLEWKPTKLSIDKGIRDTSVKFVRPTPKTILIAIPTNKYIEPECFKSIYDLIIPEGYTTTFQYFHGYRIDQIRNLIASWSIRFDLTLWIDSDIVVPNDALVKMIRADKDVISGCYIQRVPNKETLELFKKNGLGGVSPIPVSELSPPRLMQIDACGFGCVLTKGDVLRKMEKDHFHYTIALDHSQTISEDVFFCKRATDLGFEIWADTSIICPHLGSHTYLPSMQNV